MRTTILEPDEKPEVRYYSSISQHKNKLSVMRGAEWVPISYDALDAITCDGIISHEEVLTDDESDIGYNFNINECVILTDSYLTSDNYGIRAERLPEWFGDGTYNDLKDVLSFINTDNGSLGIRQKTVRRVGTKYALADKTLKADD